MSVNVLAGRGGWTTSRARAGSPAGASPDKGDHLAEQRAALVSRVVEVRRHADAAAGSVVDDESATDEFFVHPLRVTGVNRHVSAAPLRIVRRPYGEPPLERAFEERLSERHRPLPDARNTDVHDGLVARCGGVRGRDVRRPAGE